VGGQGGKKLNYQKRTPTQNQKPKKAANVCGTGNTERNVEREREGMHFFDWKVRIKGTIGNGKEGRR